MKLVSFGLFVLAFYFFKTDALRLLQALPEYSAPTPEMARLNGYRCDIHTVITEDGYVLQVHRLPGGRATSLNCSLPPVLLVHGILISSDCWLTAGPSQALGYLLADLGYDVWMGNVRGNVYGRFNIHVNVDEDSFWDFSRVEIFKNSRENSAPTPEMARLNGYRCDIHTVITEDGYVLQVHRLVGGRATPLNCSLPPVLLVHGLMTSSDCWLTAGPSRTLGYLLADLGYDVWMGNTRGNVYSRLNIHVNVDENSFWDFSFEKAGLFDLPATIDYILDITGHEKILYVGHSMGSTEFFILCSLRPEYNHKVQHMVALAPAANMTYTTSILALLAPIADLGALVLNNVEHGEFLPRNSIITNLLKDICTYEPFTTICVNLMFLLSGFDPIGFDQSLVPIIFGHTPAGTSVNCIIHFLQIHNAKKNVELYESVSPPEFNLSQTAVPLSLFHGDNDALVNPQDFRNLVKQLKVKVDLYRVNLTTFNHIDFLWAKDVKKLVNDKVISILEAKRTLSRRLYCNP